MDSLNDDDVDVADETDADELGDTDDEMDNDDKPYDPDDDWGGADDESDLEADELDDEDTYQGVSGPYAEGEYLDKVPPSGDALRTLAMIEDRYGFKSL